MSSNDHYREEVLSHLSYIKERVDVNSKKLDKLNGRVRKNEVSIGWIKGIGATITFVISLLITWFKLEK